MKNYNLVFSGRFAGQGVIVTGGAGGIGGMIVHRWILIHIKKHGGLSFFKTPFAISHSPPVRFLSDGAKVAIVDLDPEVIRIKRKWTMTIVSN